MTRAATFAALALAALAADALAAFGLARLAAGDSLPSLLGWIPSAAGVILFHLAAAALGSACLAAAAAAAAPTRGDAVARGFLFFFLSLPFPGFGLAAASLAAIPLAFSKPKLSKDALFSFGNPLESPVSGRLSSCPPQAATPLAKRIRSADLQDLRSLAIGLRPLPFERTATVLERLQRDPDTYLQIYAQGDAAEATETEESRLRILANHSARHPEDLTARLALAEHLLHLGSALHVAADQRSHFLDRALDLLRNLDSPRAHALRASILIEIGQTGPAESALHALSRSDPDSRYVSEAEAASLRARLLHHARLWSALTDLLQSPPLAADPTLAPARAFFAPSPGNLPTST